MTFARLHHHVAQIATHPGGWAEGLAMTGPRDALLLLTLEPRPCFPSALTACARTTPMNVITLTDHRHPATVQRRSRLVIGCHVATLGTVPGHVALVSLIRSLAMIDEINEEIDRVD